MNDIELKRRLREWANAYGGEQFGRLGYAAIDRLGGVSRGTAGAAASLEHGACVKGNAAEVESVVQSMEQCGRWREARVLRCEFFMPGLPEAERLQRLRRIGLGMSRAAYYVYLGSARAFVLGALAQHFRVDEVGATPNMFEIEEAAGG